MQLKQRLKNLSKVIKATGPDTSERSSFTNMTKEEIEARLKELTCKALKMSTEEYDSLTETERYNLHYETHLFIKFLREGNTFEKALLKLKARHPNYRKEIERYEVENED